MTQDYTPFATIVDEIGKLCKQKASGTLFIATKANRSAQMVLDKGEIVFVYFSSKRGEEALKLMTAIRAGRYRFQEGGVIPRRMPLPKTDAILAALGRNAGQGLVGNQAEKATFASEDNGLSQEQKDVLEFCLAECIGPMAAIICEDHFSGKGDIHGIVEALAAEIPSAGQAEKFRELVAAKLG